MPVDREDLSEPYVRASSPPAFADNMKFESVTICDELYVGKVAKSSWGSKHVQTSFALCLDFAGSLDPRDDGGRSEGTKDSNRRQGEEGIVRAFMVGSRMIQRNCWLICWNHSPYAVFRVDSPMHRANPALFSEKL
jgi:hypothetical protein